MAGEALRKSVWDPLVLHLNGARLVFVVPDGALHQVNLASLPAPDGAYLIETGPLLHHLSAERDLVPLETRAALGEGLLALGAPDFDDRSQFAALAPGDRPGSRAVATLASLTPFRGQRSACGDFASMEFPALPASRREVDEVVDLWNEGSEGRGEAVRLIGAAASEAAFKTRGPGMRVIHLATHGFFLEGRCPSAIGEARRAAGGTDQAPDPPAEAGENPLLLTGLALTGANYRNAAGPDEEDGILTAEEVAALDLSGVEWAVLSACDTGLGLVRPGEGVLGLRRAFQAAGARTLLTSLWAVDDEAARQWMRALYEARFTRGMRTAESVREASLMLLRQRRNEGRSTHPFHWAGFVASGDWK
jgi:CHAT domain-containing protein